MSYKYMDWEAEARKVARAFGIEGPCQFVINSETGVDISRKLVHADRQVPVVDGLEVRIEYTRKDCQYILAEPNSWKYFGLRIRGRAIPSKVNYDNENFSSYALQLARALFYLDELTPQVEAELGVTISEHQKMEWTVALDEQTKIQ